MVFIYEAINFQDEALNYQTVERSKDIAELFAMTKY